MPIPDAPEPRETVSVLRNSRRWWLTPLILGLVLALGALMFGDFRPVVDRFYSVF